MTGNKSCLQHSQRAHRLHMDMASAGVQPTDAEVWEVMTQCSPDQYGNIRTEDVRKAIALFQQKRWVGSSGNEMQSWPLPPAILHASVPVCRSLPPSLAGPAPPILSGAPPPRAQAGCMPCIIS